MSKSTVSGTKKIRNLNNNIKNLLKGHWEPDYLVNNTENWEVVGLRRPITYLDSVH